MLPILKLPINNKSNIVTGCTFNGVTFNIKVDGNYVDLTNCEANIEFVCNKNIFNLSTNNGITIHQPSISGSLQIDKIQELLYPKGIYEGVLKIKYPNGDIIPYCKIEMAVIDVRS